MGSMSVPRSRTWCVEMTNSRRSVRDSAITRRNKLFDGISRPLVGSSSNTNVACVARPNASRNFFCWPYEKESSRVSTLAVLGVCLTGVPVYLATVGRRAKGGGA